MSSDDPTRHEPPTPNRAEVRPGQVAPEPEAINRQDMAPGHDLAEAIAQAKRLQRVARHWRSDPCWPPVRDVIERYLPQLTIDAESDVGSEYLLRVVRQLLGHS